MLDFTMISDLGVLFGVAGYAFYLLGVLKTDGEPKARKETTKIWDTLSFLTTAKRSLEFQKVLKRA